jgi:hypothetical protein
MTAGAGFDDPKFLEAFVICNSHQLAMAGKLLFPIPEAQSWRPPAWLIYSRKGA